MSVDNLLSNKHRNPGLARIFDQAVQADLIVIDGDGDIIFATPPRRSALFFLAMMELGIRLNKPVFLVNSMISDCPKTGRNLNTMSAYRRILGKCNAVILRDPESLEYVATQMPETNRSLIPDSLFSWFPNYQTGQQQLPGMEISRSHFPRKTTIGANWTFQNHTSVLVEELRQAALPIERCTAIRNW